jgi:hypothetical protein
VQAVYRSDFSIIAIVFNSVSNKINFGQLSLTGALIKLIHGAYTVVKSNRPLYSAFDDNLFAPMIMSSSYRIFNMKNLGVTSSINYILRAGTPSITNGHPYTVLEEDSTHLWVIGRLNDNSGNQLVFHHARVVKASGTVDRAFYKNAGVSAENFYLLNSDYSAA